MTTTEDELWAKRVAQEAASCAPDNREAAYAIAYGASLVIIAEARAMMEALVEAQDAEIAELKSKNDALLHDWNLAKKVIMETREAMDKL